jgi:hypothetical protein
MQSPDRDGGKGVGSRELTVDEAQRIAVTIARLPELLGAKHAGPFPLGRGCRRQQQRPRASRGSTDANR